MRGLIALGLTVCVASAASAQTEVIIRRPGEADQVIRLDSGSTRAAIEKAQAELRKVTAAVTQRAGQLQGKVGELQLQGEPIRLNTLALRNDALAAENVLAPMIRDIASAFRQPHLGVVVATSPRETDKYGAYIQAVTPGSPAEKAGIIAGDVVTKIAGKSLTEKEPRDDSGPGVRLISIIGTLAVGKPVDVDLRRGTQNKSVKITPTEDEEGVMARVTPNMAELSRLPANRLNQVMTFGGDMPSIMMPGSQSLSLFGPDNNSFGYAFGSNGLFSSYELAPLNEKLGAYFGASEGVLVVNDRGFDEGTMARLTAPRVGSLSRATRDSSLPQRATAMSCDTVTRGNGTTVNCRGGNMVYLDGIPVQGGIRRMGSVNIGLEPGDVIVSVDGRKVTNPSQLMKIVGSYDHNDEFKLQIMRQKHAQTLTIKMP